ncbi:uncharacterized protein [Aegilops tauschii subsp. strangulata]|uniref:uncharacterized protein n=1 Tax=Aegilops tauschii subsp. strangulata TaxID=200361 RepID=UPI001ABD3753|nr:uncharacterized protein LOC120975670 [Aegilops tauschii subsp. strangulata]XP_044353197.1 uncharacterized protein LOC123074401 [Triticum aestivum]
MTPPFLAASGPDDYAFVRCASGCDSWAPHHVRLDGDSYRLCSSCVLLSNPEAYCSACLLLLFPGAYAASSREAHVDFSPGSTAACSNCGVFVAHLSCIADPYSFICPPCAAAVDNVPFSYDLAGAGRRALEGRSARVLLTAALLSHESALHDAAAAREKAERSVQEAAAARRLARDMLDAAFRAAEAEVYRDAKEQATPSAPAVVQLKKKTPNTNGHKRKTPKSNDANRERDRLLKFNDMQQPSLAFAAAAAAAASSMPSPMPSSRLNQSQVKQEAMPLPMPSSRLDRGGSADRAAKDDYRALFGTLQ